MIETLTDNATDSSIAALADTGAVIAAETVSESGVVAMKYQLDGLSLEESELMHECETHVGALFASRTDFSEELQMLGTQLPDAIVEPGQELIKDLDAIPDKMAFKIGEAADMVGVKQYVLRYWESEFEMLRPRKSKNNQRVYSRRDVETAMMIKKLLYENRFSIEGARAALRQLKSQVKEDRGIKRMVETQESVLSSALNQLKGIVADLRRLRDSI